MCTWRVLTHPVCHHRIGRPFRDRCGWLPGRYCKSVRRSREDPEEEVDWGARRKSCNNHTCLYAQKGPKWNRNLQGIYAKWPNEISPYSGQLKRTVDKQLDAWITGDHMVSAKPRLETISWYTAWPFLWDGTIGDRRRLGLRCRQRFQQALQYIEFHLGLSGLREELRPPTKYCGLFKYVAEPARGRLCEQLKRYLACCRFVLRASHHQPRAKVKYRVTP
ncbi:hypothetical protein VTK56DRAFT_8327 [Thermocarpiscus australiensis]